MKVEIFNYLSEHPKSSHHDIAKKFSIDEFKAIRLLNRLEADNMIYREILPLGNAYDPDNSIFYIARVKYSTAFKDINATEALKVYLSDAEERLEINNENKNKAYIHHYTNIDVVIKILRSRFWHLGNAKDMNDQLEYENGDAKKWKDIFFSSFMMEDKESIGMWSMYAQPWEKGVKITIPSKIAIDWIEGVKEIHELSEKTYELTGQRVHTINNEIKLAAVAYCLTRNSNDQNGDTIQWSTASNEHFKYDKCKGRLSGYIKDSAWSYEKEIRIRAEFDNLLNFKRTAITIPDFVVDAMIFTPSPLFEGEIGDEVYLKTSRKIHTEDSLFKSRLNIQTICQKCEYKKARG
jgi:hypothetical protein